MYDCRFVNFLRFGVIDVRRGHTAVDLDTLYYLFVVVRA